MFVHNCMTPEDSPLTEINCIIVPSSVLCSDCYNLASELDNLLTLKFTVVCMEAVCFSHETAKRILSTLSCDNKRVSGLYVCVRVRTCVYVCMYGTAQNATSRATIAHSQNTRLKRGCGRHFVCNSSSLNWKDEDSQTKPPFRVSF